MRVYLGSPQDLFKLFGGEGKCGHKVLPWASSNFSSTEALQGEGEKLITSTRHQLLLFSCQNPVDRFSRIRFELEQDFHRGRALAEFVFRKLGLTDAQESSEFLLS